MSFFLRGRIDGADFAPEDGGQPFLRVGAPDLGSVASHDVVVIDAATYDDLARWAIAAEQSLGYEGIGANRHASFEGAPQGMPPIILRDAAELVGLSDSERINVGLV